MENNNGGTTIGIGFSGLLTIVFIVLKLCGVIKWSWVWVLCPLWIPMAFIILLLVIALIIYAIKERKTEDE